jgi:type II secretory pathway predicted ATPase ExeA
MFRAFYSLSKTPFTKEIDTGSAFLSTPFKELSARLSYVSKARGIALITGEPGSGKTFALRHFADSLSSSLYRVVYIPLATITDSDFYRGLALGLGETPVSRKISL